MKNTITKGIEKLDLKRKQMLWAASIGLFGLAFVLSTVIVVLDPGPLVEIREFAVGEPAPRTLFSPFNLTYVNEKATQALKQQKGHEVLPVFSVDAKINETAKGDTAKLFQAIRDLRKDSGKKSVSLSDAQLPVEIPQSSLLYLMQSPEIDRVEKITNDILDTTLSSGVMDYSKKLELLESGTNVVMVFDARKTESRIAVRDMLTLNELRDRAAKNLPEDIAKNRDLKNVAVEMINAVTVPNLSFDENETKARIKKLTDAVAPVEERIKKDELILQRGMLITEDEKARLDQIQKKMAERKVLNKFLAVGPLIFCVFLFCFLYLYFFERKVLLSVRTTFLMQTVFVLCVALCKGFVIWPGSSLYWMPTALAPLLLVLLVHTRFGLLSAVVIAGLVAPIADFRPDIILASVLSGIAATLASFRMHKRSQFLKIGIAVSLVWFVIPLGYKLFQEYQLRESWELSTIGLANGLWVAALCFLVLPLFEHVFNRATDITLLELSDLNHPLLKRMVVEAPGTYHHSLVVSTLAEGACEAIGANALLARVGCYFHDIGKIARAEFFTENQTSNFPSKHEKLTPTMSCLVIMNHVKDGIALGRQYKLKRRILDFIPEHQGTGVIYYFYRKALESAQSGEKINPNDFRYPGPKPQSRETAVALLSDSTEAASRSLRDPSPESIRQLVRKIINDKFIDGQLDECDLTLRDLYKIQESFVHNLMAIFHTRVRYPEMEKQPNRPDLFKEDPFSKIRLQP